MIEIIGYWFAIICAMTVLAGLTYLVALLNILASKYFLEMLGGWDAFNEFRKWKNKSKKDT
jgi:hypothetical protein